MPTPVLFRTDKSGETTAVFPTIPGAAYMMTCYAHIGQHSSCSFEWYNTTKPVDLGDYKDLLAELVHSVGYDDLKIVKRITRRMRDERIAAERRG